MKKKVIAFNLHLFDTQTTLLNAVGNDLSPEIKTYYEKRLIDLAEPDLVHDQFGDDYPIPVNGGKTIEFRKYDSLPKALTPITEGVTPVGNKLNVTAVTATVDQYGDYIELSDIIQTTSIDKQVLETTDLLGSQSGRTLDTVSREVLSGGTNIIYAPAVVSGEEIPIYYRRELDTKALLTPKLIFEAAASLKGMNAQKFGNSYVAIIHPYIAYDFMQSEGWLDAHKYANPENIYEGEIGKIGNVRFVESTEAKIWCGANLATARNLTVKTANSVANATIAVNEAITAAQATALVGRKVLLGVISDLYTIASATAGAAGSATITLTTAVLVEVDDNIYPGEAGAKGLAVFSTLVLGAHAYAKTSLEGGGLQHIVKPLGAGNDPLNQRSTCGWKATKVTKRLVEQYMIRIESCSSKYSATAVAN